MQRSVALSALALLVGACSDGRVVDDVQATGKLPDGVVATVAGEAITAATVGRVAASQGVSVAEAGRRTIRDALFAAAARDADPALAAHARRVSRSRMVLAGVADTAAKRGPPTEREIQALVDQRWWELDRPELRRSVHAVAMFKDGIDPAEVEAAADRVAESVRDVVDAATFRERAEAVSVSGVDVRVEDLAPAAHDGRVVDPAAPPPPGTPTSRYEKDFARALFDAAGVGSHIRTTSSFGHHVILVTEVIEPKRTPMADRTRLLASEVFRGRATKDHEALVTGLRKSLSVAVERSAIELTKQIRTPR